MSLKKIFDDPESLLPHVEECRRRGLVTVFANGCFELIHVGHVRYLKEAKRQGDILIVAVNTDASMARIKPDRRPVNPDVERMEILAAFDVVDYVLPLRDETPVRLLELLRPAVHTKGTDYTLDQIPERAAVEAYGGEVRLVGGPKIRNTSDMLRELRDR